MLNWFDLEKIKKVLYIYIWFDFHEGDVWLDVFDFIISLDDRSWYYKSNETCLIENGLKMVKLCVICEIRVCMKLGLGFMMKMVN